MNFKDFSAKCNFVDKILQEFCSEANAPDKGKAKVKAAAEVKAAEVKAAAKEKNKPTHKRAKH